AQNRLIANCEASAVVEVRTAGGENEFESPVPSTIPTKMKSMTSTSLVPVSPFSTFAARVTPTQFRIVKTAIIAAAIYCAPPTRNVRYDDSQIIPACSCCNCG